jgi:hypothetical protein
MPGDGVESDMCGGDGMRFFALWCADDVGGSEFMFGSLCRFARIPASRSTVVDTGRFFNRFTATADSGFRIVGGVR